MTIAGFHIAGDVVALGLVTGMAYGVLAAGLVLIYRSSRIINFAHGDIGAFGAALVGVATQKWGWPYWLAFVVALAASGAVGAAADVVVIRRLAAAPLVISVIATLGLGQVVSIFSTIIDSQVQAGTSYPQPSGFPQFSVGALLMTPSYTAMLFVTPVIVIALAVFLRRGRLGIAMRASAANPDTARMFGMVPGRLSALSWGLAGAVAAYTAVLVLPTRGFSGGEFLGPGLLLRGLACAVVARMVNLPVALVAGVGLGVIEQVLLANYPSGGVVEMAIFVIVLVALLVQRAHAGRGQDKGSWSVVESFAPLPAGLLNLPSVRSMKRVGGSLLLIVALVVPELTSNSAATTFTLVVAFSVVGLSVVVVTGLAGQLSLGQFAIAGVGAAVSYLVIHHGVPFVVALVIAVLGGGVASLLIGLPAVRIRGLMLAVTTLAFALAAGSWMFQQPWMLGSGVTAGRPALGSFSFDTGKRYYLVAFAGLLFALWVARNVRVSGVGRRIRAVRDNEDAARSFAIGASTVKLQSFVVAGMLAGLGGAIYGSLLANEGANAFPVDLSISATAVAVIGGLGFLIGPVLGSLYIIGIPAFLPLDNAGLAATAAAWLLLILQLPGGLASALGPLRDRLVDGLARRAGVDPHVERSGRVEAAADGRTSLVLQDRASSAVSRPGTVLAVRGVTRRFGGLVAVNDVSFEVERGEIVGLMGPNGAGKTTLFELLSGFTSAHGGSVVFEGRDITAMRPEERAELGLIRSFQDAALFPTMTVRESVMLALERSDPTHFVAALAGRFQKGEGRKAIRADALIGAMGLGRYGDTRILALSTGTRRIAELACLVALEPRLLLLDEPTSGIAQRETEALGGVLRRIKSELDLTLVVIEHDIPLLMSLADRVVAMESGRVVMIGRPDEVRADPGVIASYLGADPLAIERSGMGLTRQEISGSARCAGTTRGGAPCLRAAGPDGRCHQHRVTLVDA